MRYFFFFIFFILAISVFSFIAVDTLTGNIVNTPNCFGAHTYAFYRTPAEKTKVEEMWRAAGYVPIAREQAPDSFKGSGQPNFLCLRRMTIQELQQVTQRQRPNVVTQRIAKQTTR